MTRAVSFPIPMKENESLNVYPVPELVYLPVREWEEEDVVIVIKEEAAWQRVQGPKLDWDVGVALDAPAPSEETYKKLVKRADGWGDIGCSLMQSFGLF